MHQVGVRFSGKTKDGSDFSTDCVLTFAVGNETDVAEAQNAECLSKPAVFHKIDELRAAGKGSTPAMDTSAVAQSLRSAAASCCG